MVDLRKKLRSGMIAVTPAGSYLVLTDCETANYGSQDFCIIGPDGLWKLGPINPLCNKGFSL
jgi:hypothetical protein